MLYWFYWNTRLLQQNKTSVYIKMYVHCYCMNVCTNAINKCDWLKLYNDRLKKVICLYDHFFLARSILLNNIWTWTRHYTRNTYNPATISITLQKKYLAVSSWKLKFYNNYSITISVTRIHNKNNASQNFTLWLKCWTRTQWSRDRSPKSEVRIVETMVNPEVNSQPRQWWCQDQCQCHRWWRTSADDQPADKRRCSRQTTVGCRRVERLPSDRCTWDRARSAASHCCLTAQGLPLSRLLTDIALSTAVTARLASAAAAVDCIHVTSRRLAITPGSCWRQRTCTYHPVTSYRRATLCCCWCYQDLQR